MRNARYGPQAVRVRRLGRFRRAIGPLAPGGMLFGALAVGATVSGRVQTEADPGTRRVPTLGVADAADAGGSLTGAFPAATSTSVATPIPRRPIVALDAGHGGPDDALPRADRGGRVIPWYREGDNSGAVYRPSDGPELREKDLTLRLALAAAGHLEARDIVVVLTRRGDVPVNGEPRDYNGDGDIGLADELLARVDVANRARADALVSIHLNAHPSPSLRGTYASYASGRPFSDRSIRLAVSVHARVLRRLRELAVTVVDRGVEDDAQDDPLGRHLVLLGPRTERAPLETEMPGALIEPLFMTSSGDAALLQRTDVLDSVALAIADGIEEYLWEEGWGSGVRGESSTAG